MGVGVGLTGLGAAEVALGMVVGGLRALCATAAAAWLDEAA